jgi:hypothetical protein
MTSGSKDKPPFLANVTGPRELFPPTGKPSGVAGSYAPANSNGPPQLISPPNASDAAPKKLNGATRSSTAPPSGLPNDDEAEKVVAIGLKRLRALPLGDKPLDGDWDLMVDDYFEALIPRAPNSPTWR